LLQDSRASGEVIGFVGHDGTLVTNFDHRAPRGKPPSYIVIIVQFDYMILLFA
jgi:hypothetical protein